MNEVNQTKTCSKCKEEKPVSEFYRYKTSKDGLKGQCKGCMKSYYTINSDKISIRMKEYRDTNKELLSKQKREYYKNNKDKILNLTKKRVIEDAPYSAYTHQLTIDEEPRLADDGISLEVKCKYCGKYFRPSNREVRNRIQSLSGRSLGNNFIYCSEGCKCNCSIYRQRKYPKDYKPTTSREVQPQLRKLVLKRDNWTCQKCKSTDTLHCHHIDPVASNPIESADVDNCITLCINCHKEAHQIDGCGYGELRCI